ncbi:UTP--glucose-1-phosphate uridylyltransferase [Clostridium perfringens]|nr:UTP--glucose-1-phosphate uridylyltransferase [Clostridium perfringens]
MGQEAMYAYDFEGRRYDVGDKLGFLEATVEYALRRPELREGFIEYLNNLSEKESLFKKEVEKEIITV